MRCENRGVKKPKNKRKGDVVQSVYSLMQDVIALSEKPVKVVKQPRKRGQK